MQSNPSTANRYSCHAAGFRTITREGRKQNTHSTIGSKPPAASSPTHMAHTCREYGHPAQLATELRILGGCSSQSVRRIANHLAFLRICVSQQKYFEVGTVCPAVIRNPSHKQTICRPYSSNAVNRFFTELGTFQQIALRPRLRLAPIRHGAEPRRSIRKSMKTLTLGA